MSKPLSRRSWDFFTGIPNIYSASPETGAWAGKRSARRAYQTVKELDGELSKELFGLIERQA